MHRRGFLGVSILGTLAFVAGCSNSDHCVFYMGGGATPECSEFEPGEAVATVRAKSGETVSQLRDRVFQELALVGIDTVKLVGLLGWAKSRQDLNLDDVQIGGQAGDQLTDENDPVFPENYVFAGGETIVFFVLEIGAAVDVVKEGVVEDLVNGLPAAGESLVLRDGKVAGHSPTSVVIAGDRVVVF